VSVLEHLDDFYSICEACGRTGHDRVLPEWKGDEQCMACLALRLRVAERETAYVLDKWKGGMSARLVEELEEARAEVERLRASLRSIAEGFGRIDGSWDDPSAKQVDGYYRGFAVAALEKKP